MKLKNKSICPYCDSSLKPVAYACSDCEVEIRGVFPESPFASLDEDMQHFLYVFVQCEGKIGDMEKALGISYPTVKAKIQKLKEATLGSGQESKAEVKSNQTVLSILALIEKGELDYESGLQLIKEIQEKK